MSRSRVTRWLGGLTIFGLLAGLVVFNVTPAVAAPVDSPVALSCSATPLSASEMATVRGDGFWDVVADVSEGLTRGIDQGCTLGAVGAALGMAYDPVVAAFCAGWALGRLL